MDNYHSEEIFGRIWFYTLFYLESCGNFNNLGIFCEKAFYYILVLGQLMKILFLLMTIVILLVLAFKFLVTLILTVSVYLKKTKITWYERVKRKRACQEFFFSSRREQRSTLRTWGQHAGAPAEATLTWRWAGTRYLKRSPTQIWLSSIPLYSPELWAILVKKMMAKFK